MPGYAQGFSDGFPKIIREEGVAGCGPPAEKQCLTAGRSCSGAAQPSFGAPCASARGAGACPTRVGWRAQAVQGHHAAVGPPDPVHHDEVWCAAHHCLLNGSCCRACAPWEWTRTWRAAQAPVCSPVSVTDAIPVHGARWLAATPRPRGPAACPRPGPRPRACRRYARRAAPDAAAPHPLAKMAKQFLL